MRRFKCYDCGHEFKVAYGTGRPGAQMSCPQCNSRNVNRAPSDRGYNRAGWGRGPSALGRAQGGPGRGPRWACW